MLRKTLVVFGCLILSGCQSLNAPRAQPKQVAGIREGPANVQTLAKDEGVWIPDKISKIWINSYVDDEGNMVEGHYKYVIMERGHWVLEESGRNEDNQDFVKSNDEADHKPDSQNGSMSPSSNPQPQSNSKADDPFDIVYLKSGKIIKGKIKEQTDKFIKVDPGFGVDITYYFDEIDKISYGNKVSTNQQMESNASKPNVVVGEPTEIIGTKDGIETDFYSEQEVLSDDKEEKETFRLLTYKSKELAIVFEHSGLLKSLLYERN